MGCIPTQRHNHLRYLCKRFSAVCIVTVANSSKLYINYIAELRVYFIFLIHCTVWHLRFLYKILRIFVHTNWEELQNKTGIMKWHHYDKRLQTFRKTNKRNNFIFRPTNFVFQFLFYCLTKCI